MVGIKAVWKACGNCDECNAGEDALCGNGISSGAHKNGTFQEYSIGPASYVTPVPEGIDPLIAAPLMVMVLSHNFPNMFSAAESPPTRLSRILAQRKARLLSF